MAGKKKHSLAEIRSLEREKRKRLYEACMPLSGIGWRKRLRFVVSFILELDRISEKEKIILVKDRHTRTASGTIYACTHIGGNDIQRVLQVIGESAWLMLGNPGVLYQMFLYHGLRFNGVIPFETLDRTDRRIAYARSVELLQKGGNLLIFPEAAWNLSPNLPVMKLFPGAARLAIETGADIVPIAVERYGSDYYFSIGENLCFGKAVTNETEIWHRTAELRDTLATLKWEIMERQPQLRRASLSENALAEFQNEILYKNNYGEGFTLADAEAERFHDKTVTDPEDVFAPIAGIQKITVENIKMVLHASEYSQITKNSDRKRLCRRKM
ncbi:MAG: 1-acyl-sn-glycerol-3-phosphate acyltransferase [Lachnospiraceae bacterium]|nr:1-acyl-sn-glycerol-3-phosphate acyltransferase [Lachnospiraceae bacterium]